MWSAKGLSSLCGISGTLSRSDVLYIVLGVAVRRGKRHEKLAAHRLAPMSVFPRCDWCLGHLVKGSGLVRTFPDLRWAFHEDCRRAAVRDAPSTSRLPPFVQWLTEAKYSALCVKIIAQMGSVTDLLRGDAPWMINELRQAVLDGIGRSVCEDEVHHIQETRRGTAWL